MRHSNLTSSLKKNREKERGKDGELCPRWQKQESEHDHDCGTPQVPGELENTYYGGKAWMGERCRLYVELEAGAKDLVLQSHREQQRTEWRHSWAMFG